MYKMSMEKSYADLKKSGYNTVDNIINWLKAAKVMRDEEEVKTREILEDSCIDEMVELEKFQVLVQQVATEHKKLVEDVAQMLASEGPRIMEALEAAAKAFEETMNKK